MRRSTPTRTGPRGGPAPARRAEAVAVLLPALDTAHGSGRRGDRSHQPHPPRRGRRARTRSAIAAVRASRRPDAHHLHPRVDAAVRPARWSERRGDACGCERRLEGLLHQSGRSGCGLEAPEAVASVPDPHGEALSEAIRGARRLRQEVRPAKYAPAHESEQERRNGRRARAAVMALPSRGAGARAGAGGTDRREALRGRDRTARPRSPGWARRRSERSPRGGAFKLHLAKARGEEAGRRATPTHGRAEGPGASRNFGWWR